MTQRAVRHLSDAPIIWIAAATGSCPVLMDELLTAVAALLGRAAAAPRERHAGSVE